MSSPRMNAIPYNLSSTCYGGRAALLIGEVGAEGGEDASPLLVAHFLATVAALGDLGDLVAPDPAKPLDMAAWSHRANPDWTTSPAACPGCRAP